MLEHIIFPYPVIWSIFMNRKTCYTAEAVIFLITLSAEVQNLNIAWFWQKNLVRGLAFGRSPLSGGNRQGYVEGQMHSPSGPCSLPRSLWEWGRRVSIIQCLIPQTPNLNWSIGESKLETLLCDIRQYWLLSAPGSQRGIPWRFFRPVMGVSTQLPRQSNITYLQMIIWSTYDTRRPKHPHLPFRCYKWLPRGPPCFTALLHSILPISQTCYV